MKEPIYKVSCIVIGSKCAVMRSTSQLVDTMQSFYVATKHKQDYGHINARANDAAAVGSSRSQTEILWCATNRRQHLIPHQPGSATTTSDRRGGQICKIFASNFLWI